MGKLSRKLGGGSEIRMLSIRTSRNPQLPRQRLPLLKKLFWLYFLLLIFEGALRKWILPQYSAPLLLIRDPIAFFIIWEAYRTHKWPKKWSAAIGFLTLGLVALFAVQVVVGDNPWFVGVYGLRSYLLPFPVAFIMGENLDAEDMRKFGFWTLWLLLPLTALEIAQYLLPPSSILNAGAYAGASQITYAGGHVRASGTFSYVTGPIGFGPLAAAFIFYGLVNDKLAKKWLLWACTLALIISVPVVGARTLVFELAAVVVCAVIAAMFGVSQFIKSVKIAMPLVLLSLIALFVPVFSQATNTLHTRFVQASASEGDLQQSFYIRAIEPLAGRIGEANFSKNWIGMGMGRGSAAMQTLLNGTQNFVAGETEADREMDEFGPFPGLAFMLFRYLLALMIVGKALARARDGEPLALLFVPGLLVSLVLGTLEQPTDQGFMVIFVAFSLAALKVTSRPPASRLPSRMPVWRQTRSNLRSRRVSTRL